MLIAQEARPCQPVERKLIDCGGRLVAGQLGLHEVRGGPRSRRCLEVVANRMGCRWLELWWRCEQVVVLVLVVELAVSPVLAGRSTGCRLG